MGRLLLSGTHLTPACRKVQAEFQARFFACRFAFASFGLIPASGIGGAFRRAASAASNWAFGTLGGSAIDFIVSSRIFTPLNPARTLQIR